MIRDDFWQRLNSSGKYMEIHLLINANLLTCTVKNRYN